jgi:hypothetical protein
MPFPISCRACGATFNIPDDIYQRRVAGRVVNIRCKQCKADILVDGTVRERGRANAASHAELDASPRPAAKTPPTPPAQHNAEPSAAAAELDGESAAGSPRAEASALGPPVAAEASVAQIADESIRPAPLDGVGQERDEHTAPAQQAETEPRAPLAAVVDLWAVSFGEEDDRELTEAQIAEEAARGNLHRDMLVWREGMEGWVPLHRVPELARLLPEETDRTHEAALPTNPAAPPPLARTTLGVGPVPMPPQEAKSDPEAARADDPVATPVLPVARNRGASPAVSEGAPVPAAPILAPPPVFAPVVEPGALAAQQPAYNPFMGGALPGPALAQEGALMQGRPPVRPSQPVSFELEALPPVKRGRPVLWMTAIVAVVAVGIVIGLMSSWTGPQQAVPSAVAPTPSAPATDSRALGTISGSSRGPTQAASSGATAGGRVDLFAPPGSHTRTSAGTAKSEPKRPTARKPDLAEVFADKLQNKGPKR